MSSTNDHSSEETSSSLLPIQNIIERITKLHVVLNSASQTQQQEADIDSPQRTTTAGTTNSTAATNQRVHEQDGNNIGDNNNNTGILNEDDMQEKSNNQKGNELVAAKNNTESNKKEQVRHESSKICKELYMISSFKKLESFETNLSEPLKTLEANVDDILKDLSQVKPEELSKQVPLNLLCSETTSPVKIQIPSQHQTTNKNSEANRALQTTVASSEAENLPHLYNEDSKKAIISKKSRRNVNNLTTGIDSTFCVS